MRGCVNFCCGRRDNGRDGTETRGVLRGPRGPKKKETVANIKSENNFICICSVTVLVNCSGQGLTSFPRVTKPKLYFLARIQFISLAKLNHISIPSKMALFLSSIYLKVPPHTTILDLSQNNLSEVISQFANSQLTAGQIAVHCATITKR